MHWKHSRYQILYQILSNCHTVDEAYRILCELEEDRQFSIDSTLAESKRAQAKVISNKSILDTEKHSAINGSLLFETKGNKLQAEAFILEAEARRPVAQACLDECRRELSFIRAVKNAINPFRKYIDYVDYEAHQLCQAEEYYYDLLWRSYNHLCSMQGLPSDHWMLIKMHPMSDTLMDRIDHLLQFMNSDPREFVRLRKFEVFSFDNPSQKNLLWVSNIIIDHSESGIIGIKYEHDLRKIAPGSKLRKAEIGRT